MASNSLPRNSGLIIQLGGKMETGIKNVGASVPVTMVTATQVHDDTAAFAAADNDFNIGRSALQAASDAYQATLGPLYTWLLNVSNMLASRFGTRWNTSWAQAGFIDATTAVPNTTPARITLAQRLVNFFTKNPSYEVASMGLTAAAGTALFTATQTAQGALSTATVTQKDTGNTWATAYEKIIATMTALLKNLEGKLSKDDTRWLAFGLQIPANITTPGQPVNVTAHIDGNGNLVLQCDAVSTAWRYRFRMMILGVQTDYTLVASSTEPIAAVSKVEPGQTVQIVVQAVSGNLQGKPSDPIVFTIPLPPLKSATAAPDVLASAEQAMPAATASDGHANGNRLPALS